MSDVRVSVDQLSSDDRRALLATLLRERAGELSSPLSHGQRALWFVQQTDPSNTAYNVGYAVSVHGKVDVPTIQRVMHRIVERHAALRSTIVLRDGQPVQQIHAARPDMVEVEQGTWSEDALSAHVRALYGQSFDLSHGPLFRAHLLVRSSEQAVLLVVAHHIVFDGWSLGVLMDEFSTLYGAALADRQVTLPPAARYADFVRWQSEMLDGPRGEQLTSYWLTRLAGELPRLDVPLDRPRPVIRRMVGASESIRLDDRLARHLKALAKAEQVTLYSLLLGAFKAFLYRYTGQSDILVLTPMAGRSRTEFDRTIGYFVSPTVLRTTFSGEDTFRQLVQSVHETVLGALEHQDFPFPLLVERLAPERDPGRSLITDAMFGLISLGRIASGGRPGPSGDLPEQDANRFRLTPFPVPQEEGQVDLAFDVLDLDETLACTIRYATDLYDQATAARMLRHFQELLEGIVANPDATLASLPLLPAEERQQILDVWSSGQTAYQSADCLHELFEAQVIRTPDAVAVICGDELVTYQELDRRADCLADQLRQRGVGPQVLVGLSVGRSAAMVVGLLGILKAGGAYVPLDPTYPTDRLAYMLDDSAAAVLVTEAAIAPMLPACSAQILHLDALMDAPAKSVPNDIVTSRPQPEDLAYVIYTSGSTGRPKGVMIPHRAVVNFLTSLNRVLPHDVTDMVCAVTSMSFDIAVLEVFWPLIRGASTVVVSDPETFAGGTSARVGESHEDRSLLRALSQGANLLQCTPSMLRLILQDARACEALHRVKLLLLGGEPVSSGLINEVRAHTAARIFNMYGPTETTVWSAIREVDEAARAGLIGAPLANEQMYVVDGADHLAPIGVMGELLIGGDGLARGYLHRPELTAERFIPDNTTGRTGARLYRTGDLARFRSDGTIEFLGRLDRQVKLRGYRIELAEIETVLVQYEGVGHVAVLMRKDTPGDARLVAYFTTTGSEAPSPTQLRRFLKGRLPDYMVPSVFVRLSTLPLTPNGKLDTRSLPSPSIRTVLAERRTSRPRTPTEERIAPIFEDALGVPRIDPDDSFVDLGGHSLLAAQVAARIEERLGTRLNPALVLMQTLAQLAETCDDRLSAGTATTVSTSPAPSEPAAPSSRIHERLLGAARRLLPGGAASSVHSGGGRTPNN